MNMCTSFFPKFLSIVIRTRIASTNRMTSTIKIIGETVHSCASNSDKVYFHVSIISP